MGSSFALASGVLKMCSPKKRIFPAEATFSGMVETRSVRILAALSSESLYIEKT